MKLQLTERDLRVGLVNPANFFTSCRPFIGILGAVWFLRADTPGGRWAAVLALIIGAFTDFFDGRIARRFNCTTDFGAMLDPIADKLFMLIVGLLAGVRLVQTYSDRAQMYGYVSAAGLFAIFVAVAVFELITVRLSAKALRRGVTFRVGREGKIAMFGKMTFVVWTLAYTIDVGNWYAACGFVALIGGLVGVNYSHHALQDYKGQAATAGII